jgi:hypothetical protein
MDTILNTVQFAALAVCFYCGSTLIGRFVDWYVSQ